MHSNTWTTVSAGVVLLCACSETPRSYTDGAPRSDAATIDHAVGDGARPDLGDGALPRRDQQQQQADQSTADGSPPQGSTLSARYPGDVGLASDPAVLFFDDFEQG